jgi:hypothetical protein
VTGCFTERLYKEAEPFQLHVIEVGTTMTQGDLAKRVTEALST